MMLHRQLPFLLSVLCLVRADRNDATAGQASQHDGKQQGRNMSASKTSGNFLTELFMCGRPEDLRRFELGPFAHSVSYNDYDLTGSTWQPTTFVKEAIPGLGFAKDLQGNYSDYAEGGSKETHFAWIDSGPAFAPMGGFIFKDVQKRLIIGCNELCRQEDDQVTYRMTFKAGVNVGNVLPESFAVGRMRPVLTPELQQAGMKRYTWIHRRWAQKYFPQLSNIEKGGFLYEVNGSPSYLEFYERRAYSPDGIGSAPYQGAGSSGTTGLGPLSGGNGGLGSIGGGLGSIGGGLANGGGIANGAGGTKTITIRIEPQQ